MTETPGTTDPVAGASESTPNAAGGDTNASNGAGEPTAGAAATVASAATTSDTDTKPADTGVAEVAETLLSEEEFESLQDDPAALRAALNKAYTQKTQQLGPARQLLDALAKDPDSVIKALVQARGFKLQDHDPASAATSAADEVTQAFEQVLGPESAKLLRPALDKLLDEKLKPYREAEQARMGRATVEHAKLIEKQFTELRPDWKQHEKKMIALSKHIRPEGLEPLEYMDLLYTGATKDNAAMKRAEKLFDRTVNAAKAIAETKVSGTASTAVTTAQPKDRLPSLREASAAAMRGERFQ